MTFIYGSWDIERKGYIFLSSWTIFCLFKKTPGNIIISHMHTMTIIWHMVPEIWSVTNRTFCHIGPFFCPFTPLTAEKTKISKKWRKKKMPGVIIILHKCTKNYDLTLYCYWDMACDRYNYFSFWAVFCPFTPQLLHWLLYC